MGAFQSGFGMGMQLAQNAEAAKERKLARERQDKLDQITIDAASRKAEADTLALEEARRLRDKNEAVRLAGTEMKGAEGYASGAAGQQIFSADKSVAQATTDINNAAAELEADPMPGATPGATPSAAPVNGELRAATGVTGGGKPSIAGPGLKFDNSPEGRMKRQAAALRDRGYGKDAQDLETEFATNQSKLYDAQRNLLFGNFMKLLRTDGAKKAIEHMYAQYGDGLDAEVVEDGKGGGTIIRRKGVKEVDRTTYKDLDDAALMGKRALFPEQYLEAKEKAASETVTVKPGEEIYQGGVLRYKNNTPTSGEASWARALAGINGVGGTGSGGAGGARGAKPEPTLSDRITDILASASKDADGAMRLSPDDALKAGRYGSMIGRLNPNIDPYVGAYIARQVATNPSLVTPLIGDNGRVMGVYMGEDGKKVIVGDVDVSRLSPEQRATMKPEAAKVLADISQGNPETASLFHRIAFGDKAAEQQARAMFVEAQSQKLREQNPRLSALQVNELAGKLFNEQVLQQNAGKLRTIGQLLDPPKAQAPQRQAQPTQQPARAPEEQRPQTPSKFSFSGGMQSPDSREAIEAKLLRANSGGSPLSPREQLLARQFGLTN